MGRVKAMIMDEEEQLNNFVWSSCSESETFEEFKGKVKQYCTENNIKHLVYADGTSTRGSIKDVWNEYWSNYNMERG